MENHKKHSLGHRAFFLFLSKRIRLVIFSFLFSGIVWYAERWLPASYVIWEDYAFKLLLLASIAYLVAVLFQTYLEYRYYTYMFTDEAFIMTSGLMVRNEIAALYHQIQNVNIERGPLDRMAGVSRVIILMAGSEHGAAHTKIVLPAVGKTKAKLVQKELLQRARRHFVAPPVQYVAAPRETGPKDI